MSGWHTYSRFQQIEEHAKQLGFRLGRPMHGWSRQQDGDMVSLYPDNEALPVYSRDAELFIGTFYQVETFLAGWAKAQEYDYLLRLSDDKRRKKYEVKERERQRLVKEREEKKKVFAILSTRNEKELEEIF